MEATGSYWKPVWYVLEERAFAMRLVHGHHVKILPGRKSDVLDAEWLAELLEHGLLRGQLRAPAGDPGTAGPDPLSETAHPGPHRRVPADPEDPGGHRDQTGFGRLGGARRLRAGHASGAGRRGTRPGGPRRAGQRRAAQEDPRAASSPARALPRPPRPAHRAMPRRHRLFGDRHRPPRRAHRRPDRGTHQRGWGPFRPDP